MILRWHPREKNRPGSGAAYCPGIPGTGYWSAAKDELCRQPVLSMALIETAGRYPGDRILVVAHMGIIMFLVMWLEGVDYNPDRPELKTPGVLHWLTGNDKELRIERLCETLNE